MKTEYYVTNGDGVIAVVYKHDTLGRIIVLLEKIDPNFNLEIHNVQGQTEETVKVDMLEFFMKAIPQKENKK